MHSFHVSRSLYHIIYGSAFQMTVEKFWPVSEGGLVLPEGRSHQIPSLGVQRILQIMLQGRKSKNFGEMYVS